MDLRREILAGYGPLFVSGLVMAGALCPDARADPPDGGLLLSGDAARTFRQEHGAFFSGTLALTLNAGASISEIFGAWWCPRRCRRCGPSGSQHRRICAG